MEFVQKCREEGLPFDVPENLLEKNVRNLKAYVEDFDSEVEDVDSDIGEVDVGRVFVVV